MKEFTPVETEEESNLSETLAKLWSFVTRRRWWILLSACSVSLATVGVLRLIPNQYTSAATLLVVSQQVPQRYVVPNSTTDLGSTLEAMKQEVLSRTRLWKMISDFDLYSKQRKRLAPEQLIALMLADIDIDPISSSSPQQRDFDSFKISFTAESPYLAQQVTSTLTSLFISENVRTREEQASNTTKFLHEQVVTKGKKLEEQEQRLRDFKLRHVGELPEQQQGNLSIMAGLQSQLQNTTTAIGRAHQQKAYLQSLLDTYQRAAITGADGRTPAARNPNVPRPPTPVEVAQNDLAVLEAKRTQLLSTLTPEHPDVAKNQREIGKAEETLRRLKAQARKADSPEGSGTIAGGRPVASAELEDPTIAQTKSQLEANRIELQNLSNEERRLKAIIAQYENRLNQTPVREQEQAGIVRDTEALRLEYSDLLKKEQESQLATNLEKQQGGQQFRLIDQASLPEVPSSPKRMKVSLAGLGFGIVIGIALAFLVEVKDTALYTEKDVAQCLAVPLAVSIPLLPTPVEVHRRKWKGQLELAAGSVLVLAVIVAQVYVYKVH